jgi:hypothetical protein
METAASEPAINAFLLTFFDCTASSDVVNAITIAPFD